MIKVEGGRSCRLRRLTVCFCGFAAAEDAVDEPLLVGAALGAAAVGVHAALRQARLGRAPHAPAVTPHARHVLRVAPAIRLVAISAVSLWQHDLVNVEVIG